MKRTEPRQLFSTGQLVATHSVMEGLELSEIQEMVFAHTHGSFGDLCEEDAAMNMSAIATGEDRILSAYEVRDIRYYVITEWDRSVTTILEANEY